MSGKPHRTIVILDDEAEIPALVAEVLKDDHETLVLHFEDEAGFLAHLDGDDFDEDSTIALIDISIGTDREAGFTAAEAIANREISIPIIFVSEAALGANIRRSAEVGSYAFLNKPRLRQYHQDLRSAIAQAEGTHARHLKQQVNELTLWGNRAIVLAGSIGHEIRRLVKPALVQSLALKQRARDCENFGRDQVISHTQKIISDLERAQSILNNAFNFIRGQEWTGLTLTEIEMVSFTQLLLDRFSSETPAVRFQAACARAMVRGDETMMAQMIFNLVHNAQRYASAGAWIDVTISVDGANVDVSVRDYGLTKLSPSQIRRIWRPLVRGHNKIGEGGGIGLAIVKEFAAMHGGTNYHTLPGDTSAGNIFGFSIPLIT
jgi:signal transduction histidine kinase